MAIQPIQYLPQAKQFDLAQGLALGGTIRDIIAESRKQEELAQAKLQAKQTMEQYQADLKNALSRPDRAMAMAELSLKYPQQREAIKQAHGITSEDDLKRGLNTAFTVSSYLDAGNTEQAMSFIDNTIEANKNSNLDTKVLEQVKSLIEYNPGKAKEIADNYMATFGDPKEFIERSKKLEEIRKEKALLPGVLEKKAADIGYTKAQTNKLMAETKKLNLEAKNAVLDGIKKAKEIKSQSPISLSSGSEKLLNDSAIQSEVSRSLMNQYNNLANKIEENRNEVLGGSQAKAAEYWKKFWGNQDQITAMRQDYLRLKNTAVLNMLPPGTASDRDIETAQAAFPDENANPEVIASFMRGMAKLQNYESQLNQSKAGWISQVGNLGTSRNDVVVDGVNVPAGTSFNDFIVNKFKSEEQPTKEQQPTQQPAPQIQEGMTATNKTTGQKVVFRNGKWEAI